MWLDRNVRWAVLLLAGLGCLTIVLHLRLRERLKAADNAEYRQLRYVVEFEAEEPGVQASIAVPGDGDGYQVFRRDVRAARVTTETLVASDGTTELMVRPREPGEYTIEMTFDLRIPSEHVPTAAAPNSATDTARYLGAEHDIPVGAVFLRDALADIARRYPTEYANDPAEAIFRFCRDELTWARDRADDPDDVLEDGRGNALGLARTMVALSRQAGVPARLVCGFLLNDEGQIRPHVWCETYTGDRWRPDDPALGGEQRWSDHLPVAWNRAWPTHVAGEGETHSRFFLRRQPPPPEYASGKSGWAILDLTRLPLPVQETLGVLLLIPFGAVVTCLFRNVVGLETSGRFAPVLLALSFVFSDWRMGLVVLGAVLLLGLTARSLVEGLQLLVMPRLSLILTLVVWIVVFGVSVFDYFEFTPTTEAVLLPMVILTMIVERFFLTSQEEDVRTAVRHLGGTLIVAAVCYGLLRWESVGRLLVAFPEIHILTMACLLILGRYTGYRLAELWRFRQLAR
ncbi:MAG: hypothetical protein D6741_08210 [Planctomycetota bacterium]|nr:MAG: hypothetical protein D6741_08210 [Planctomycetota bacterium]